MEFCFGGEVAIIKGKNGTEKTTSKREVHHLIGDFLTNGGVNYTGQNCRNVGGETQRKVFGKDSSPGVNVLEQTETRIGRNQRR